MKKTHLPEALNHFPVLLLTMATIHLQLIVFNCCFDIPHKNYRGSLKRIYSFGGGYVPGEFFPEERRGFHSEIFAFSTADAFSITRFMRLEFMRLSGTRFFPNQIEYLNQKLHEHLNVKYLIKFLSTQILMIRIIRQSIVKKAILINSILQV